MLIFVDTQGRDGSSSTNAARPRIKSGGKTNALLASLSLERTSKDWNQKITLPKHSKPILTCAQIGFWKDAIMLHPDSFSLCAALSLSFFLSGMALPCQSHEGKQMSSLWRLPPFLEKLPRSAECRSQWKQREVKLDMETCPKTPGNAAETALAKIKMEPHPLRIAGSILLPTNLQHGKKI